MPLLVDDVEIDRLPPALRELHLISTTGWAPHELPSRAAQSIARSVGRWIAPESWSIDDSAVALRVEVYATDAGEVTLGWASALWQSQPAPLVADSLSELARAADEARAAELHVGRQIEPAVVALVLGILAARLGPAHVRLHTDAGMAQSLANVARRVQAMMAEPRT